MALTKVQVISQALMKLGKKPIMNLLNQSDIVTAASAAFDFLFGAAIGEGQWRFTTTIKQLSQLVAAPVGGYWLYAYQLPADYEKLIRLFPQTWDFEIFENNKLYSNYNSQFSPLYIEYQFVPVVENVPDYFWKYFIFELSAHLALSNAQSAQYAQILEPQRPLELAIALAADAQNRPQTPLQSAPVVARRSVGTFIGG